MRSQGGEEDHVGCDVYAEQVVVLASTSANPVAGTTNSMASRVRSVIVAMRCSARDNDSAQGGSGLRTGQPALQALQSSA